MGIFGDGEEEDSEYKAREQAWFDETTPEEVDGENKRVEGIGEEITKTE